MVNSIQFWINCLQFLCYFFIPDMQKFPSKCENFPVMRFPNYLLFPGIGTQDSKVIKWLVYIYLFIFLPFFFFFFTFCWQCADRGSWNQTSVRQWKSYTKTALHSLSFLLVYIWSMSVKLAHISYYFATELSKWLACVYKRFAVKVADPSPVLLTIHIVGLLLELSTAEIATCRICWR